MRSVASCVDEQGLSGERIRRIALFLLSERMETNRRAATAMSWVKRAARWQKSGHHWFREFGADDRLRPSAAFFGR